MIFIPGIEVDLPATDAAEQVAPAAANTPKNSQWFDDADLRLTEEGKQRALSHLSRIRAAWAKEEADAKEAAKARAARSLYDRKKLFAQSRSYLGPNRTKAA